MRLSIISAHESTRAQDVATCFEGVLLDLEAVGLGSKPRAAALRKLGISTQDDYNTFNRMFKKSWGKKSPRYNKVKYKAKLLIAQLRHIELTPWSSQVKRKVSGVRGHEEERLLTVL